MATEKKDEPELDEKDFIQEKYKQDPFPLWASIIAFILVALAIYAFSVWMDQTIDDDQVSIEETNPAS